MVKRFHCEFKTCDCTRFELFCNGRCKHCNHGRIWHSLTERPLKTCESQFLSTRLPARKPYYIYYLKPNIFTPIPVVTAYPVNDDLNFCITVDALPV